MPTSSRSPPARRSRARAAPACRSTPKEPPTAVLATILNSFKVAEIRKKLAFTAALLALYRLGSFIPVPGVSTEALEQIEQNYAGSNILGFLNLFTGGGLSRIALFALGIMPYITASIILQLLTVVSPSLEKLQKEGEVGQARITQYTRYLTVGRSEEHTSELQSRQYLVCRLLLAKKTITFCTPSLALSDVLSQ